MERTPPDKTDGYARGAPVVHAVVQATLAELGRVGFKALRVEDVASLAGVNKTTIYRRWPTKIDLVVETMRFLCGKLPALPDTGALRTDLVAELESMSNAPTFETMRGTMRMVMAEMPDPEFAAALTDMRSEHAARWVTMVQRAIARGELPPGTDPQLLMETVTSPVMVRLMKHGVPIPRCFVLAVVDLVLRGALCGGAVPPA